MSLDPAGTSACATSGVQELGVVYIKKPPSGGANGL